ncbi:hypothetical protein [Haploplasma axanthum]|uniref:Uncharacterized protein n=1 Tax=Haploplasma axanthum TaxID=29552 RepID=A0A449BF35_HAPAX|nr:hypothetical protein [Haploplasma axanthum]VEU81035.1 Uncharacterised protein [Haploplasma axanthum]
MNLIDKYVYNVIKDLPEKQRSEVSEELTANIYDMLAGDESDANIEKVILELGNPKEIALSYSDKEKYVVGPKDYAQYLLVLRTALIIASILFFFFGAIIILEKTVNRDVVNRVFSVLLGGLTAGVIGLILSYATVTFVFQIISLSKVNLKKKPWNIQMLEEVPKEKKYLISKKKTIIEMTISLIIGFLGVFILTFYNNFYFFGIEIVLNKTITSIYIPLFFLSIILLITKTTIKMKVNKISYKTTIYDTIYSLITGVLIITFMLQEKLFVDEVYDKFDMKTYQITMIVLSTVLGIFILTKLAIKWYRTVKSN